MADLLRVPAVNVGWHAPRHAIHEKSALSGIETVPRCGLTKAKQPVGQSDATSYGENAGTRAVVVLARAPQATKPATAHYHVSLLAQLVATKDGHP